MVIGRPRGEHGYHRTYAHRLPCFEGRRAPDAKPPPNANVGGGPRSGDV